MKVCPHMPQNWLIGYVSEYSHGEVIMIVTKDDRKQHMAFGKF
jgi:hypothetical protein